MTEPNQAQNSMSQPDPDTNAKKVTQGNGGRKAAPETLASDELNNQESALTNRNTDKFRALQSEINRTLIFLKILIVILILAGIVLVILTSTETSHQASR